MEDVKCASIVIIAVQALLSADKKIKAIKLVRDIYECGLNDAKEFVELLQD